MAEFVEFRAEEWISELEQMERIRLFDSREVKTIASKRKELEYKIQRRTKCKDDFLKFIQFEIDLHRIVKARRQKTGIKMKMSEIDHSQTRRIGNLFKRVLFRFPQDVKLWMSFFKFCKGVKFHSLVSHMLVKMLQYHSNKSELWVFASEWEAKQCKSISNARQFLTRGLRHHPSSELLYVQLFKLELEHMKIKAKEVEQKKSKDENWTADEVTENILQGKVAEVVYESALKAIPGVHFKVNLLNISKKERAPKNLQNKIFQDLIKCHLTEELAWDAIAQRELAGLTCDLNKILGEDTQMEVEEELRKLTVRDRIQRSVGVYEEAIKKLNTPKMWSLYLDHVLKLNEDVKSLPVFKAKLLRNAMEGALDSGHMSEKHYLEWIDSLRKNGNKKKALANALKRGTERYPDSLPLWHARLKFYLSHDQEEPGMQILKESLEHLPDAVPLWKLMVKYLLLKSSPKGEEVFKEGIKRQGAISQALKPFYIEWLARTKGISEAREAFGSPELHLPPCLELYRKMAALEANQSPVAVEKVRKCHELTVANFGENDPSTWLDYIKFELSKGEKVKVAQVHRRALQSLNPEVADDFVSEYNNLKIEYTKM